jgi:hypothetical protein
MQRETTCRAPDCPGCEPADIGGDGLCDGCWCFVRDNDTSKPQQRREEEVPFG